MIHVGILGGETRAAGELIRILLNHPDVVLAQVSSEPLAGQRIDRAHRGLIGDTDLTFAATLAPEHLDAVFLCGEPWQARAFMDSIGSLPQAKDLRFIDLTGAYRAAKHSVVYGLPEHNRKALVRGARFTATPTPEAMVLELALFPLAKNRLLDPASPVHATVTLADTPDSAAQQQAAAAAAPFSTAAQELSTRLDPIAPVENRPDTHSTAREVTAELADICSQSFPEQYLDLRLSRDNSQPRGVRAEVLLDTRLNPTEMRRLFDQAYSDHSFTYTVDTPVDTLDVANTNKCLIHIDLAQTATLTPAPQLRITAVADNLLKGAAGNAVHCLNLLFGLSERTGLQLKASAY